MSKAKKKSNRTSDAGDGAAAASDDALPWTWLVLAAIAEEFSDPREFINAAKFAFVLSARRQLGSKSMKKAGEKGYLAADTINNWDSNLWQTFDAEKRRAYRGYAAQVLMAEAYNIVAATPQGINHRKLTKQLLEQSWKVLPLTGPWDRKHPKHENEEREEVVDAAIHRAAELEWIALKDGVYLARNNVEFQTTNAAELVASIAESCAISVSCAARSIREVRETLPQRWVKGNQPVPKIARLRWHGIEKRPKASARELHKLNESLFGTIMQWVESLENSDGVTSEHLSEVFIGINHDISSLSPFEMRQRAAPRSQRK